MARNENSNRAVTLAAEWQVLRDGIRVSIGALWQSAKLDTCRRCYMILVCGVVVVVLDCLVIHPYGGASDGRSRVPTVVLDRGLQAATRVLLGSRYPLS